MRSFPLVFALPFICLDELAKLFFLALSVLETVLMFLSVPAFVPVFVLLSVPLSLFLSVLASVLFALLLSFAVPCPVLPALFEELPFRDGSLRAFPLFWDVFDVLPPLLFEGAFLLSSVKK